MIPVQKHFPPERLRKMSGDMYYRSPDGLKKFEQPRESFDRWKLSQQIQSWLYAAIGGAVLCVVIFVVAGGCR